MGKQPDCDDLPSDEFLKALVEFNRREWYECHETLEELWVGTEFEIRWFYQGILQIAVALMHWRNGNYGGAISLLASGGEYLKRVCPVCQLVEVASLVEESERFRMELVRLGPEKMAEIPEGLIPKLRMAPL